ncbi:hypothetical protein [Streptomyces sp. bgisy100]|uniref:hypothetical protein n=1 Tax=Streptomyces sp. bgisy100 TaxID=3413783 RepID=UPI003D73B4AE
MTRQPDRNDAAEWDQLHRHEITVAMNWVIRTCQMIIRDHSHKTFWVPTGTHAGNTPTTIHLIESARADVLNKLLHHIHGAESIISNTERERAKRTR